ncbi:MFS transporter [Microlunatus speluncae]|uniref:MFS transporter n=1 Tax=Microlunatus speluncae TaxID=2594267 RepID=UPI0012665B7B|nr:MFS transporter [Microlunatus speluncae]
MNAEPTETDQGRQSATQPPAVSRRALAIGICTVVVAVAFEAIAVATAMPAAARELNGISVYAWAFSLFLIGMLLATVVAGRICDRIGPGWPFLAGVALFTVGIVVAATSLSMGQLIGGRLIQGLGGGVMNVASFVCIAQVFDERTRPRMFTYISTAWVVPSFVGPPISAWLTENLSWHWVFWSVLPLVAVGLIIVLPTLRALIRARAAAPPPDPAADAERQRPAPLWAAGLVAVSAAAIQLAGQRLDWLSVPLVIAGLAGLGFSLPRLMPPGFLRLRRGLPMVIMVRGLLPGAFFGAEVFVPLMLVEQRGVDLFWAGAVLTCGAVGWSTGAWLQSRPWIELPRNRLISLGTICVAAGLMLVASTALLPQLWVGLVAVGWVIGGFGMGLGIASTSIAAMALSRDDEQGRNASSLQLGDSLGAALFAGVSGTIFAALHPTGDERVIFGTVMAAMVIVALLGVAGSTRMGRPRKV